MGLRILHLPTSTGGNAWGLAQAERMIGMKSDVLVLNNSYLQYPADYVLFDKPMSSFSDKIIGSFYKFFKILKIRHDYDVFHFNFGSSLIDHPNLGLELADLPLFQQQGKTMCVTYNGCDARQKYPTMRRVDYAACHENNCFNGMCNSGNLDRERQKKINRFDKFADHIFALNPDLFYFLPERTKFLPYTIASWNQINRQPYQSPGKTIKIAHAPTNRAAKGSAYILAALEKLQNTYPGRIEILLVEGLSHAEAIQKYQSADLVIDQLLIGWYGALAVEVIKMGKPVMVFIREEDLRFIPSKMAKDCVNAFILADKTNIFEKLCDIVENPDSLSEFCHRSYSYICDWHDPLSIAKSTRSIYEKLL